MTEIKAWIQNHPSRADLLPALVESTGLPTEVVTDHGPPPGNPWRGYQLCLERVATGAAEHGVILQDDAVLCKNFGPAMERIADANPETPVVLFLAGLPRRTATSALRAAKRRESYVRLFIRDFCPVVGMLWPKHKAQEVLDWTKTAKLPGGYEPRSDDAVIGRWMLMTKQDIQVTVPSLVQHPDRVPSLIGRKAHWGKDRGRVALMFCEGDPLEHDWS